MSKLDFFGLYFWLGLVLGLPALAQLTSLEDQFGTPPQPQPRTVARKIKKEKKPKRETLRPADSFQEFLLTSIRGQDDLPDAVREWAYNLVRKDYTGCASAWPSLKPKIPVEFRTTAVSAQLYLLRKLELNQTFIDQWMQAMAHPEYEKSPAEAALEAYFEYDFDLWLLKSAITLNDSQQKILAKIESDRPAIATLRAYADLRDGTRAAAWLEKLAAENKLNIYLMDSAFNASIGADDLNSAASLLKKKMEPAALRSRNPELMAKYDLSVARLLYQAGRIDLAIGYYRRIPNRSAYYLPAREELAWALLRKSEWSELRGELKSLATPALRDRFQPEVFLLRAMSDLKLCMYDQVEADIAQFQKSNLSWARSIDEALSARSTPPPPAPDEYTLLAVKSAHSLEREFHQLENLAGEWASEGGPWNDYARRLKPMLDLAQVRQNEELRRQWHNRRVILEEAIRKMRFVKLEYDNQMSTMPTARLQSEALLASNAPADRVIASPTTKAMNFPVEVEVWPDEFFRMRSAAQTRCLAKGSDK